MNVTRVATLLFCTLMPLLVIGANEDHIDDLASRYDLVGVVTHTSVLKWNTNPNSKRSLGIYPIDPAKVKGGALYVGLVKDRDPDMPYFGDIYIKGWLFGYNELFVRVLEVKDQQMRAMDDNGNDFLIKVIRHGKGYKRR